MQIITHSVPSAVFTLDTFKVSEHGATGLHLFITGWYHGTNRTAVPRIKVMADSECIGYLHFHIQRPDLDTMFGTAKSPRGFQDTFTTAFRPRVVRFVRQYDERVLLTRKISRFEFCTEKPFFRALFMVYERAFLRSSFNNPIGFQRLTRFLFYGMHHIKTVKKHSSVSASLTVSRVSDYDAWVQRNTLPPEMLMELMSEKFPEGKGPLLGVIYPRMEDKQKFLQDSLDTLRNQVYTHYEVYLSVQKDENINLPEGADRQMHSFFFDHTGEASCMNALAKNSKGEYLVIMDAEGVLPPHALLYFAIAINDHPEADVWYADEDLMTDAGKRENPWFKPDFDYAGLLSHHDLHRPLVIRRSTLIREGGFDPEFEGAGAYAFLLKLASRNAIFVHIPDVLYHHRNASFAEFPYHAQYVDANAAFRALNHHLAASGKARAGWPSIYRRKNLPFFELLEPVATPGVEIIIPARNQHIATEKCLQSLLAKTSYPNYTVWLIDNDSDDPQAIAFYQAVRDPRVRVKRIGNPPEGFSFSHLNNQAAKAGDSDFILFLNNDTEIIEPDWLNRMMAWAMTEKVGCVGARLLFPDKRVQHAGVFLDYSLEKMPDHCHAGHDSSTPSNFLRVEVSAEKVAVTAACMLTPRKLFLESGGFDEQNFPVNYNDIDYCIRIRRKGYRVVYCAGAILIHHQGLSRSGRVGSSEILAFRNRYKSIPDPFYNPNLRKSGHFEPLPEPGPLTKSILQKQLRILFYSHNFNFEGAPGVVYDVSMHMAAKGHQVKMIAPYEGPSSRYLNANGVETAWLASAENQPPVFLYTKAGGDAYLKDAVSREIDDFQPDVVYVNVLHSGFVVNLATQCKIPAVWMIHESFTENEQSRLIPHFNRQAYLDAFRDACMVIFCTPFSSRLYESFNSRNNFRIIRNMLKPGFVPSGLRNNLRAEARKTLGIDSRMTMVLNMGIIALHKNQELIVRAAARMRNENIGFYLVGAREGNDYLDSLRLLTREMEVAGSVRIIEETRETRLYYLAADIFCFPSVNETYPYAILEAMASGLPIVCTPVNGVNEQVRFGENALRADFSDPEVLVGHLRQLHANPELREKMGQSSKEIFDYLNDFDGMMQAHEDCILESRLFSRK